MITITNKNIYYSEFSISTLSSFDKVEKIHMTDIINFLSDDVELGVITDSLAPSLFGDTRIVVIKDIQDLTAECSEEITDYLSNPDENLNLLFKEYQKKIVFLESKVNRLSDLLSRRSAQFLPEIKRLKMKNQLNEFEQDLSFSRIALDQISFRISQVS